MFTSIIGSFLSSVQALRLYVDSVELLQLKDEDKDDMIMPMMMYLAKEMKMKESNLDEMMGDGFFPDDVDEEMQRHIKQSIKEIVNGFAEMVVISEDGKSGRYIGMPKELRVSYRKVEAMNKQSEILYGGSLMLLITYFETTISKLVKADFKRHPQRMSLENKTVSYKLLEMSSTIEDIKEQLIEEQVSSLMYKSATDWIEYLRKNVKMNLNYVLENLPRLREIIARRNIIVHNEGIVNAIYLNTVSQEYRKDVAIGDVLDVDKEYIYDSLELIESIGVAIIIELWVKECVKQSEEMEKITTLIFDEYLQFDRWEIAKELYEICLSNNKLQDADVLLCKINRWLCYKRLGKFELVRKEVEDLDISACQTRYQLGVFALLEKNMEFYECYKNQTDINLKHLSEWPLYKEFRESQYYDMCVEGSEVIGNSEKEK